MLGCLGAEAEEPLLPAEVDECLDQSTSKEEEEESLRGHIQRLVRQMDKIVTDQVHKLASIVRQMDKTATIQDYQPVSLSRWTR